MYWYKDSLGAWRVDSNYQHIARIESFKGNKFVMPGRRFIPDSWLHRWSIPFSALHHQGDFLFRSEWIQIDCYLRTICSIHPPANNFKELQILTD